MTGALSRVGLGSRWQPHALTSARHEPRHPHHSTAPLYPSPLQPQPPATARDNLPRKHHSRHPCANVGTSAQPTEDSTVRQGAPPEASASSAPTATGWHPLAAPAVWAGSEADALACDSPVNHLSPPWKVLPLAFGLEEVMLLSDGSVTRHLQLLTGFSVEVECLQMAPVGPAPAGLPPAAALLEGALLQRQVFLRRPSSDAEPASPGQALIYAASWWRADQVQEYLLDSAEPIWVNLSRGRIELYREIQSLQLGHSSYLEQQFGRPGPFWGRQYLFWHKGKPLTLIHEVFSPALTQHLGEMNKAP